MTDLKCYRCSCWPCECADGCAIVCGDCREVLQDINADAVITDPPYGKRPLRPQGRGLGTPFSRSFDHDDCRWDCLKKEAVSAVMQIGSKHIIWGGQYYGDILPSTNCLLIWDKHQCLQFARCEVAWTDLTISNKLFDLPWRGAAARRVEPAYHPTQKPVSLISWCIDLCGNTETILDPFMGSGTTLVAAKQLGRRAIGIEIEEKYCEIAANRLANEPMPLIKESATA